MAYEPTVLWEMIEHIGVDPTLIKQAKAHGITVEYSLNKIYFKHGGSNIGELTVTLKGLALLKEQMMGPATKTMLKETAAAILSDYLGLAGQDILATYEKVEEAEELDDAEVIPKMLKVGKPKPSKPVSVPKAMTLNVPGGPEEYQATAESGLITNSVVSLAQAKTLLQPVTGTSKGSVYFLAALITDGPGIAIRFKGETLSIRVAGANLKDYNMVLASCGFNVSSDYASVHFKCGAGAADLAVKTFGAVLGRIGLHRMQKIANLDKLIKAA